MDQDEIEEELFYQSIFGHIQLLIGILQSSPVYRNVLDLLWRHETLYILLSIAVIILSVVRNGRLCGWLTSCTLVNSFYIETTTQKGEVEWSEVAEHCIIYSMQGRRPCNEDRAVERTIRTGSEKVRIFAVLDGHGGEFSVNFATKHLLDSLERAIHQLKVITSSPTGKRDKILVYEQEFGSVPACVKSYLGVSEAEYRQLVPDKSGENGKPEGDEKAAREGKQPCDDSKSADTPADSKTGLEEEEVGDKPDSRNQLVLSSRQKALEELPVPKTPTAPPKKPFKSGRKTAKPKPKTSKGESTEKVPEITDYIGSSGEVLYAKLIKDEILKCDKELLIQAKKANAIGGTTLLLTILDGERLWVGNVGDSRGIYCSDSGQSIPLSFDHKPCQLKEKRRIQEAGGFVSLNGVWRVQGVLATSRALGDYPLKDKNVVVADPDVLSFNIHDHKMEFAVLATDGLWDTHSNDEVAEILRRTDRNLAAVTSLASDSYRRGSTDNITIILININNIT